MTLAAYNARTAADRGLVPADLGVKSWGDAAGIRIWQAAHGLAPDGHVGPLTADAALAARAALLCTGLDVSGHNADIVDPGDDLADMQRIKTAGHACIVVKASEGTTYKLASAVRLREAARTVGLVVGSYHYARPRAGNATAEAEWYASAAAPWSRGELPPVLDIEDPKTPLRGPKLVAWCEAFLRRVETLFGRRPMIYTGRWYWRGWLGATPHLVAWPLWLAQYPAKPPPPDAPFPMLGPWPATIWQYTAQGSVPGLRGHFDVNRVAGGEAGLRVLIGATA